MDRLGWAIPLALGLSAWPALAAETTVAVAANFIEPAEAIAIAFNAATGHEIILSSGATGALYAQIAQAAPFTVFLSADSRRAAQAVTADLGVAGTIFTYAVGELVLYSPSLDVTDGAAVLKAGVFQHIAIADPDTAPYGFAAMEVIRELGLSDTLSAKLVTGESVTQTMQFIETGNAEIGLVSMSQVIGKPPAQVWRVPAEHYSPILQDAVLLKAGENDPVAKAFLEFLKSKEARAIIETYGYQVRTD